MVPAPKSGDDFESKILVLNEELTAPKIGSLRLPRTTRDGLLVEILSQLVV